MFQTPCVNGHSHLGLSCHRKHIPCIFFCQTLNIFFGKRSSTLKKAIQFFKKKEIGLILQLNRFLILF